MRCCVSNTTVSNMLSNIGSHNTGFPFPTDSWIGSPSNSRRVSGWFFWMYFNNPLSTQSHMTNISKPIKTFILEKTSDLISSKYLTTSLSVQVRISIWRRIVECTVRASQWKNWATRPSGAILTISPGFKNIMERKSSTFFMMNVLPVPAFPTEQVCLQSRTFRKRDCCSIVPWLHNHSSRCCLWFTYVANHCSPVMRLSLYVLELCVGYWERCTWSLETRSKPKKPIPQLHNTIEASKDSDCFNISMRSITAFRECSSGNRGSSKLKCSPGKYDTICCWTRSGSVGTKAKHLPASNPKFARNSFGLFDTNLPDGIVWIIAFKYRM